MSNEPNDQVSSESKLQMVADIITAYVSHNPLPSSSLPDVIANVHSTIERLSHDRVEQGREAQKPAVPIKKSVTDDYLICLEDGKKLKMLKRYLRTQYGMTPEEYRAKWNLPSDYPMVAPNYARRRSEFAKQIGLGRGGRKRK